MLEGDSNMKSTGIVRKVDELGRIVIPMELRRTFGIEVKDPIEIYVEGDKIILTKYRPTCVFCGGTENLETFKKKNICKTCRKKLSSPS